MYPVPFRQAVLLAYTHLRSLRKTAKLFALAVSTVRRWLIRLHPHKWPERTRTDVMEFIVSLVKSNPFITTQNVCTKVRDVFCFSVSRKLVCLVLKREGSAARPPASQARLPSYARLRLTFKRARHGVAPSLAQLDKMPEFCTRFEQSRPNLICIDETNVSHKALSLYGWSRKGDRLKTNKAAKSWTSKTLVMACSENQYHSQLLSTACNSQKYAAFIESLPFPPGSVILMDNVAFHKSSTVREMLLSKEYTALYTPPYTPDANPVENIFSRFKSKFRSLRTKDNIPFDEAVQAAVQHVHRHPEFLSATYDQRSRAQLGKRAGERSSLRMLCRVLKKLCNAV